MRGSRVDGSTVRGLFQASVPCTGPRYVGKRHELLAGQRRKEKENTWIQVGLWLRKSTIRGLKTEVFPKTYSLIEGGERRMKEALDFYPAMK